MFRYRAPFLERRRFKNLVFDFESAHFVEAKAIEAALEMAARTADRDFADRLAMYRAAQAAVEVHLSRLAKRRPAERTFENTFMYRDGMRKVINAIGMKILDIELNRPASPWELFLANSPLSAPRSPLSSGCLAEGSAAAAGDDRAQRRAGRPEASANLHQAAPSSAWNRMGWPLTCALLAALLIASLKDLLNL